MNRWIFTTLIVATSAFAQQSGSSGSGTVDLTAPGLSVHASLPQMNTPWLHGDLRENLAKAQSIANQKGIAADGIVVPVAEMTRTLTADEIRTKYEQLACAADAIVTGHTSTWTTHLNASGQGVYTDYDFVIDTVIKDNAKAHLTPSQHVVMARPGGLLQLGTGTVDIEPGAFPKLKTGSEYLIFLLFVPSSGGYQPAGPDGTFIARDSQWSILREAYSALTLPEFSLNTFATTINQWVGSCKQ